MKFFSRLAVILLSHRRPFLIAAGASTVLMALGLASTLAVGSPRWPWAGLTAVAFAHGLALAGVEGDGRRVRASVRDRGLPAWVVAQAEKAEGKVRVSAFPGLAVGLVAALAGSGSVRIPEVWLIGLLSANLAYQVGAFLGEFVVLGVSIRLARDVESWVEVEVEVPIGV